PRSPHSTGRRVIFVSQRGQTKTFRESETETPERGDGGLSAGSQSPAGSREDLSNLQREQRLTADLFFPSAACLKPRPDTKPAPNKAFGEMRRTSTRRSAQLINARPTLP